MQPESAGGGADPGSAHGAGARLAPLLAPRSIAFVGASARVGRPGHTMLRLNRGGPLEGRLYPVNPRYSRIDGIDCYASLGELPEAPDLVVLGIADLRLEEALCETVAAGGRAALIFGGANLEEPEQTRLVRRLTAIAEEAEIPLCGGNCMGFYNLEAGLRVTFSWPSCETRAGGVALVSHSGSSWSSLTHSDGRLRINLPVSSGQELNVGVADYMRYALSMPTTRAIGLVLETVRRPADFVVALAEANARRVPVMALKVGRTEQSARLAISHSGAIVGDDAAYEAIFERYGVGRAQTLEELAAGLLLLSHAGRVAPGGLAVIHDSGFERELLIDLAKDHGTALACVSPATRQRLAALLDPGLEPVNTLDAWGTGRDYERVFTECLDALMEDPDTACGFISHSLRAGFWISEAWARVCGESTRRTTKAIAMVSNFPWVRDGGLIERMSDRGVPVIGGMGNALDAARHLFEWRDFLAREAPSPPAGLDAARLDAWRARLETGEVLGEAESLALLSDYGLDATPCREAASRREIEVLAETLDAPVVLKTAMPGVHHKSDGGGVVLDVAPERLVDAYDALAGRLGPRVVVADMAPPGVEMALGLVRDPHFGSLVMIAAGGVLIEALADRLLAVPPFDRSRAEKLIARLRCRALLDGRRGRPAAHVGALADAAARLSVLAQELGASIAELDVNPVVVGPARAVAVDALVVPVPASLLARGGRRGRVSASPRARRRTPGG